MPADRVDAITDVSVVARAASTRTTSSNSALASPIAWIAPARLPRDDRAEVHRGRPPAAARRPFAEDPARATDAHRSGRHRRRRIQGAGRDHRPPGQRLTARQFRPRVLRHHRRTHPVCRVATRPSPWPSLQREAGRARLRNGGRGREGSAQAGGGRATRASSGDPCPGRDAIRGRRRKRRQSPLHRQSDERPADRNRRACRATFWRHAAEHIPPRPLCVAHESFARGAATTSPVCRP